MGAEQAFQWGVSYPDFSDLLVATSGTARCWPHGIVRLEAQIAAIEMDPAFKGGDYVTQPTQGVEEFSLIWSGWLFSQEWWRQELWRQISPKGTTFDSFLADLKKNFIPGADANDLILQARTWERHDVGTTRGFDGNTEKALATIRVPVLYMPSATDLYFPVTDARYEARFIPHVTLTPIPSLWGHPAGAGIDSADAVFLNQRIGAFLTSPPK
jgi:homoserine O-acetyltransferase